MRDLSNYEVVNGECKDCILHNKNSCTCIFNFITGSICNCTILKKKQKWVKCTKENTKAGDTVRSIKYPDMYYTVDYVYKHKHKILITKNKIIEKCFYIDMFEVQEKEE